jgi:hypothetical protein
MSCVYAQMSHSIRLDMMSVILWLNEYLGTLLNIESVYRLVMFYLSSVTVRKSGLSIAVQLRWLDRQIEVSDYLTPNHQNHVNVVNFVKHQRSSVNHVQPYRGVPNYEYYPHLMCLV